MSAGIVLQREPRVGVDVSEKFARPAFPFIEHAVVDIEQRFVFAHVRDFPQIAELRRGDVVARDVNVRGVIDSAFFQTARQVVELVHVRGVEPVRSFPVWSKSTSS